MPTISCAGAFGDKNGFAGGLQLGQGFYPALCGGGIGQAGQETGRQEVPVGGPPGIHVHPGHAIGVVRLRCPDGGNIVAMPDTISYRLPSTIPPSIASTQPARVSAAARDRGAGSLSR